MWLILSSPRLFQSVLEYFPITPSPVPLQYLPSLCDLVEEKRDDGVNFLDYEACEEHVSHCVADIVLVFLIFLVFVIFQDGVI